MNCNLLQVTIIGCMVSVKPSFYFSHSYVTHSDIAVLLGSSFQLLCILKSSFKRPQMQLFYITCQTVELSVILNFISYIVCNYDAFIFRTTSKEFCAELFAVPEILNGKICPVFHSSIFIRWLKLMQAKQFLCVLCLNSQK